MNAVEKIEPKTEQRSVAAITPMDMLSRAVESNAGLEMVEKLMSLQERWETGQARKAFDRAIAAAKAKITPIQRNAKGHNDKRYADFAAIAKVVDPILSEHGLSYRFRTAQGERISVTCILSHEDGHSEETTLSGPPDSSGNKNPIQSIGSTLSYLQRYSLIQMLGLAAANDDDGKAAGAGDKITDQQALELADKCKEVSDTFDANFCTYFGIETIADLPAKDYQRALIAISKKKGAAK